jgi:hypothetical protein
MIQSEPPYGSVATIGHPGNGTFIVKTSYGRWRRVDSGELVDNEDFRAGWDLVTMPNVVALDS